MKSRTLLRLNAVLLGSRAALGLLSPLQIPKMLLHQQPHLSADRAEPILPFLLTVLTPVGCRLRLRGKGGGIQLDLTARRASIQIHLILASRVNRPPPPSAPMEKFCSLHSIAAPQLGQFRMRVSSILSSLQLTGFAGTSTLTGWSRTGRCPPSWQWRRFSQPPGSRVRRRRSFSRHR